MKKTKRTKKIVRLILVIMVLGLLYKYNRFIRPAIPTEVQLEQSLQPRSRIKFRVPKGNYYAIVFGFQNQQDFIEFPSSGRLCVLSMAEDMMFDKQFKKEDLLDSNWLRGEGLFARSPIIAPDGDILHLDEHLIAGHYYYIDLVFSESMPTNVSVWLSYLR